MPSALPDLAVELAICSRLGIPLSDFLAWPDADRAALIERWLALQQD